MEHRKTYGYIADSLSEEAILEQLVEECGELVAAASKRLRILRAENYTPVSTESNYQHMMEEASDVAVCLNALAVKDDFDQTMINQIQSAKVQRWAERLMRRDI